MIIDYTPPFDIDAEKYVLGAILLAPQLMAELALLRPEHFHGDSHGKIFDHMRRLHAAGAIDPKLLIESARKAGVDIDAAYLGQLATSVPNASHARYYADIVRDKWELRTLLDGAAATARTIVVNGDADAARQAARKSIEDSLSGVAKSPTRSMGEIALALCDLDTAQNRGFPTGIRELDTIVGGWWCGEFTILAALTSAGKSAMALELAFRARGQGKRVLVFSCEMTGEDITYRGLQRLTGLHVNRLRQPHRLSVDERLQMQEAADSLRDNPIVLCDEPSISVDEIHDIARLHAIRNGGLDLLIVDYLQLLDGPASKSTNGNERVSAISRKLRQLPKQLDVPVLALSQFSREAAKGRPQLSHLRDSGTLEQDCHNCWFLWQPGEDDTERTLIIEKNRNGPRFQELDLQFDQERLAFHSRSDLLASDGFVAVQL